MGNPIADKPILEQLKSHARGETAGVCSRAAVEITRLSIALAKSVALQSHYAALLNMTDGGQRIVFANYDEWIKRLDDLSELPHSASV